MVRHKAFLPGLGALVVALLASWRAAPPAMLAPPFQGIERADRAAVARLREVWRAGLGVTDLETRNRLALRERAAAIGEPASRALVEILAEHHARAEVAFRSWADRDEMAETGGVLVGELATEKTARALVRAVSDRRLSTGLRRAFLVALCRERFAFAAEPLAAFACDRGEDPDVREAILCRLHRFGRPPPAALRDLLYEPYRGIDALAAATLAISGDLEAPSLVLDGLRSWGEEEEILRHCAEAARRITGKRLKHPGSNETIVALEEWIAAHPQESGFERSRREYLASGRRARELRVRTHADVAAAGEDFDLAAVSLWLTMDEPAEVEASLERLFRLTRLCEVRLSRAGTPAERIGILNGLLAQRPVREERDPRRASSLAFVLRSDFGNCLARSTLYLGVAERLDLPLRPYVLPEHVYVAWEEGGLRRCIETTDRGVERPADGVPASRRAILGVHLSNRAATLLDAEAYGEALRCASGALAFDRSNAAALVARAIATWQTDLDADPRRDVDRAVEMLPEEAGQGYRLVAAEMAWKLGFPDDALRRAEDARRIAPSPEASALAARALLDLGDAAKARELADAAAERWPGAAGILAFLRLELDLEASIDRTDVSPLWTARALLRRGSPDLALARLDAARPSLFAEGRVRLGDGAMHRVDAGDRREFHLLEAQALAGVGRIEEAREALRAAEEAAPVVRETLEVRRLLDGR